MCDIAIVVRDFYDSVDHEIQEEIMRNVGFQGGSSIFEVGSSQDVDCFFHVIRRAVALSKKEDLLLKRIFLRYVKMEDIAEFSSITIKIKEELSKKIYSGEEQIYLRKGGVSVEKYNIYFDALDHCLQSSIIFFEEFKIYKPLRIVVTDMPDYMLEKIRPLAEYDALSEHDTPFWLR